MAEEAHASAVALVRPAPLPARRDVVAQLAKHLSLVEEGATPVAAGVEVPQGTSIDLIARDERDGLIIVDVFDGREPAWIAHALHHLRWLEEHRASYADAAARVRAIAVVSSFSPPAKHALDYLTGIALECFVIRCYAHEGGRFLALERRGSRDARSSHTASAPTTRKTTDAGEIKPVELTEDEIGDFLEEGLERNAQKRSKARDSSSSGQPFI